MQRQQSKEDEWTVIDPHEEFEGAVQGLKNGSVGMSLLHEDPSRGNGAGTAMTADAKRSTASQPAETEAVQRAHDAQVAELRNQLQQMQEQLQTITQENQALRIETTQLAHKAKQNKEILAKYVHEKEALERSAVDAEEVSATSVQFLTASQGRLQTVSDTARRLRLRLLDEDAGSKQSEELWPGESAFRARTLETAVMSMESAISDLEGEFGALESTTLECVERYKQSTGGFKISLTSFSVGDLALFFPTPHGDFLAFNAACPHHYLSDESKALIGQDKHFRKFYVLGKIVYVEESTATASYNPFKLPIGTVFKIVSVTSITHFIERRDT
jgi:regulator of replication initiation timing